MKYIIHSYIIFDTTEYILTSLKDSAISIKLPNSAGRILEELIKYRNIKSLVTREHLFTIVWKSHGLSPSHGNLNQQISLIRKTLMKFGLKIPIIITIPKRGLRLNNQLSVEDAQQDIIDPQPTLNKQELNNKNNEKNSLSNSIILNNKTYAKYVIILTITCFTILSIGFIYLYNRKDNIKLYCCKEINSCDVCSLPVISEFECNDCKILYFEII